MSFAFSVGLNFLKWSIVSFASMYGLGLRVYLKLKYIKSSDFSNVSDSNLNSNRFK